MRDLRLHFREWRADAPSLVLLHGFTGHARSWDAFAEAMTDRYRVLALARRGHGETQWAPTDQYKADDMVENLEGLVASLDLKRFWLLGLSLGGLVAMLYAGRSPEPIAARVLVDFGPEIDPVGQARIRSHVQAVDIFANPADAFAAARADNSRPPEAPHQRRSDAGLMLTGHGRWIFRYDRTLRSPSALSLPASDAIWRSCAAIAAPTLILRGELSNILSQEVADRMVRTIPDACLATVAGAGHAVPYDAPEAFLSAVRGLLTGSHSTPGAVLVTGGTGFIGGWAIVEVLRRGYRVRTAVPCLDEEAWVRAQISTQIDPATAYRWSRRI